MKAILGITAAAFLASTAAFANPAPSDTATLTVTGTVSDSMEMFVSTATDSALELIDGSTNGASNAMGVVQKFGEGPNGGWVRSATFHEADYSISGNMKIEIDVANSSHDLVSITAGLGAAPAEGVTWQVAGASLTEQGDAVVASNRVLDANKDHVEDNIPLVVTIKDTAADNTDLGAVITFTAALSSL